MNGQRDPKPAPPPNEKMTASGRPLSDGTGSSVKLSGLSLAWRLIATWIAGAFVLGILARLAAEVFRTGWTLLGMLP